MLCTCTEYKSTTTVKANSKEGRLLDVTSCDLITSTLLRLTLPVPQTVHLRRHPLKLNAIQKQVLYM